MSRFQRILRGSVAGVVKWTILATGASSVTGIAAARLLGPTDRGTLALAVSVAGTAVLISAMGSNVAIRVHLPKAGHPGLHSYIVLSSRLLLALVIVLVGAGLIMAHTVDPAFDSLDLGATFTIYGVLFFLSNQLFDLLNAEGRVSQSAKYNALGSCVTCLGVMSAIVTGGGLVYVVSAYSAGVLFQSACSLRRVSKVRKSEPAGGVKILWLDGLRLLGLNLGQSLTYTSDRVVLGAMSTPGELGQYAVAVTPAGLMRIPANALGQVAFHAAAAGSIELKQVSRDIGRLMLVVSVFAAAGCLVANPAITLVFGRDYEGAVTPFRILLIAELALIPFLVIARVLAGLGHIWAASACGIVGFLTLMLGCVVLIPSGGAQGAAMASAIAYATMSATSVVLLRRMEPQPNRSDRGERAQA